VGVTRWFQRHHLLLLRAHLIGSDLLA
jgi:hypothetical protein